jgi:hypothetical protein
MPGRTLTYKEYPKGSIPVQHELTVPDEQEWLWYMLSEQTKILKSIKGAAQWVAFVVLILVIVSIFHP